MQIKQYFFTLIFPLATISFTSKKIKAQADDYTPKLDSLI